MSDASDKTIAFSRFAARMARGKRIRRGDTLLDHPDPRAAVAALPADEFFYLVAERGLPEAQELLLLGSPEQVQTVLDIEAWDRDRLSLAKAEPWLSALVEAPFEQVQAWLRGFDVELVALLLRRRMKVWDLTLGEEPEEEPEGQLFKTPDGFFMIEATGGPDAQRVTLALIEALYSADLVHARRVLVALNAELDSDLEEQAYRWRAGRLADLGFVDYYEALEVYAPLDPATVEVGEATGHRVRPFVDEESARANADALRMPRALAESVTSPKSRFARALSGLTDDEQLADVHAALVALSNRVLSADRVTPSDAARIAEVLARMQGTLDLALEYLARTAPTTKTRESVEREALQSVPLLRLHRLGVSLVAKVSKAAQTLLRENPFASATEALALWAADDAEVLSALTAGRPLYPRLLDPDPAHGTRPFGALADVARATARLERLAMQVALVRALGVEPRELSPERWPTLGIREGAAIDFGVLARTVLVGRLLGNTHPGLHALSEHELARFAASAFDVRARAFETLCAAVPGGNVPQAAAQVARDWADSLVPLEPVLKASEVPTDA